MQSTQIYCTIEGVEHTITSIRLDKKRNIDKAVLIEGHHKTANFTNTCSHRGRWCTRYNGWRLEKIKYLQKRDGGPAWRLTHPFWLHLTLNFRPIEHVRRISDGLLEVNGVTEIPIPVQHRLSSAINLPTDLVDLISDYRDDFTKLELKAAGAITKFKRVDHVAVDFGSLTVRMHKRWGGLDNYVYWATLWRLGDWSGRAVMPESEPIHHLNEPALREWIDRCFFTVLDKQQ